MTRTYEVALVDQASPAATSALAISLLRGLFSYQIYVRARALPTVPALLRETEKTSAELKRTRSAA